MILSEYLIGNDLFGAIENVQNFAFIKDNSNSSLAFKYGHRVMFNNVLTVSVDELAQLIVDRFGCKWDELLSVNISDYKLGADKNNISEVHTVSELDKTSTGSNINQVTGYNSDSMIDDGKTLNTNDDNESIDKTVTMSNYQLSLESLFENLRLSDKTNIINTVQTDIINFITLYIY